MTGASTRNWDGYASAVAVGPAIGERERAILTDPQTSGGLLVACAPDTVDSVLEVFRREGFADAVPIRRFGAGPPQVNVD